ncbi:MAG TPA: hypothetical protein VHN73_07930, partial [Phenylobacterium sp.]|nr:hypothetical protein [Phenylobacterium sp.]
MLPAIGSAGAAGYARALRLLSTGDFREGWPAYEARIGLALTNIQRPPLPFPEWRGENLAGKRLLVWPEQGLGDKIMFARFIPRIAAGEIVVLCEPALERLF